MSRLPAFAFACLLIALISACSAPDSNALLADARASFAAGEEQTAMIHLKNLLRINPNNREGRLLRSKVALAMEDGFTAEIDLRRAEELGIERSDIVLMLGQSMMLQGAYDRVVTDIHTGAASDKQTRIEILLLRGDAYLGLGKLDNAGKAFLDVARLVPKSPDALVGLGRVAQANGDIDAAINYLARAISVGAGLPHVWRTNGQIQLAAGRPTEAIESFRRATALEPVVKLQRDDYLLLSGLLRAHLMVGETDAALNVADQAMDVSNGHPLAHYLRGQYDMHTGDNDAAVAHFQKTLTAYPQHLGALSYLGGISLDQGKLQAAETYLRQAIVLDSKNPQIRMQLAQTMLRLQQGDDALYVLVPVLRERSDIPELLALAGRATAASKDRSEWLSFFEQAAAANPTELKWQYELAGAYIAAGEPDKSVQLLLRIPDSAETSDPRDLLLVEAYAQARELSSALEVANRLLQRRPDDVAIRAVLGRLYLAKGDLTAARNELDTGLSLAPDSIPCLLTLGQVEVIAENPDAAEVLFRQAYAIQPDHLPTVTLLVMLAQQRRDSLQAIEWLQAARLTNPDSVLPLVGLVALHLLTNDVSVAYEIAQEAVAMQPQDPRALIALGITHIRREEFNLAVNILQDAAIAAPDNGMVQFELSKALLAAKKTTDARRALRKSVSLSPWKIDYAVAAAKLELAMDNGSEAIQIAAKLTGIYPDNPLGYRLLGLALTQQSRLAEAADAFGKAWELAQSQEYVLEYYNALARIDNSRAESLLVEWLDSHPLDWQARAMLAQARHKNGDTVGAIEQYEQILNDSPGNTVAMNNLAWLYLDSDLSQARKLAEDAHRLQPHVGMFTDTLGWVLVKQGKMARGIELLRLATQQSASAKDIRYHLAVALAQIGDAEEARLLLSELINSGESFDGEAEARELLQRL